MRQIDIYFTLASLPGDMIIQVHCTAASRARLRAWSATGHSSFVVAHHPATQL